jgi:hypothetical protein
LRWREKTGYVVVGKGAMKKFILRFILIFFGTSFLYGNNDSSIEEIDNWVTFYYQNPHPEKIFEVIKQLHELNYFQNLDNESVKPYAGFFSKIFGKNPSITLQVADECSSLSNREISVIELFLWFANTDESKQQLKKFQNRDPYSSQYLDKPPSILDSEITSPSSLDFCWGSFFASGETVYIQKIIENLKYKNSNDPSKLNLYGAARWSLKSNCEQHLKVAEYCSNSMEKQDSIVKEELQKILIELSGLKKK